MTRATMLAPLLARRAAGDAIVVAGVGSGLTASAARAGGADLLACYGTAVYRILGVPTVLAFLPYDDANRLTLDLLPTIVERAGGLPVIGGLGAHDPRRSLASLVGAARDGGAGGVTNEPFAGIYSPAFRAELEASGYGFGRELAMLELASREELLTLGWVFDPEEARRMAGSGVDIVGTMTGITGAGSPEGALDQFAAMVRAVGDENPAAITLLHGGPLVDAAAVASALVATGADGYATGSSAERGPVFGAVRDAVAGFRALRTTGPGARGSGRGARVGSGPQEP
jgi:predicted TIM-barrel enzyme